MTTIPKVDARIATIPAAMITVIMDLLPEEIVTIGVDYGDMYVTRGGRALEVIKDIDTLEDDELPKELKGISALWGAVFHDEQQYDGTAHWLLDHQIAVCGPGWMLTADMNEADGVLTILEAAKLPNMGIKFPWFEAITALARDANLADMTVLRAEARLMTSFKVAEQMFGGLMTIKEDDEEEEEESKDPFVTISVPMDAVWGLGIKKPWLSA